MVISLLRGINVGGHHKIKMDALRALYESLGLRDVQTFINSGNVIFRTDRRDFSQLTKRIETGIEKSFGFHSDVVLRTSSELRDVIARNPFAKRSGLEPAKLLVTFFANAPAAEDGDKVRKMKFDPEEVRIADRELYVYYPDGLGRSKLPTALIEKMLKMSGTARNWNTVTKLLELAGGG